MRLSGRVIFLISVLSAGLAFLMTTRFLANATKEKPAIRVVAAVKDLPVGYIIQPEDIKLVNMPDTVNALGTDRDFVFTSLQGVLNQKARVFISRGKVIKKFDLIQKDENIMNLIPAGYRAFSLLVSLPKEVSRYIGFGSRIDILFASGKDRSVKTKTIMKFVLVLNAVPQTKQGGESARVALTLAIRPEGAELLNYAQQRGTLRIIVRPPDEPNAKEEYVPLSDLEDSVFRNVFSPEDKLQVEIIRGTEKEVQQVNRK